MGSATMRQVTLGFVMVEVKHVRRSFSVGGLSKRAQEVFTRFASSYAKASADEPRSTLSTEWRGPLPDEAQDIICIPQKELAKELGCSRWTIGRAIKKLKEAGLLQEIGRDKQSRCKTYAITPLLHSVEKGPGDEVSEADKIPLSPPFSKGEATPQGLVQLQNYRHLFECNLGSWPDWEKHYAAVTWELKDVECIHKLFRQTFDRLYVIRQQETGVQPPN